ncbi:response regulator [Tahibacter amnicola]|uniref:Response regulator transcription factor n=1 Tax=Tahibacter amnicola TaxID=2976241 RepID=A0ABY6BM28_9GAMM|nr:response regulator transcription factor [Tahibacter amnicola]UXI69445.1 response regulator transcription factor [Tahibacter amnicola]
MTPPIRVVIADDHVLVRQGIRAFLDTCDDLSIVGEADSASSAAQLCEQLAPDVALVDLVMPGGGVEATRMIRAGSAGTQVLILTSYEDDSQIVQAVQAGALSYLLKDADADTLADAVRRTARGEAILHPRIATRLIQAVRTPAADATPTALDRLSQREREVLELMADGLSNQVIATRMGIGEKTVKTHVSNVLAKLELQDRTQAAVYAWRTGVKS